MGFATTARSGGGVPWKRHGAEVTFKGLFVALHACTGFLCNQRRVLFTSDVLSQRKSGTIGPSPRS
jgi:hypothetical protein